MNDIITYRCQMCGKEYAAHRISFGIFPNQIHCHECEGTATVKNIEPYEGQECNYVLLKPTWNDKRKFRNTEGKWYKRWGLSEWEIDRLFEQDEKEISEGMLILICK